MTNLTKVAIDYARGLLEHHKNEKLSPEAQWAFINGLLSQGVRCSLLSPNWKTEKDKNPNQSRFIEGIDPNRIWTDEQLSGNQGLPTEILFEARRLKEYAKGKPFFTLHRDQDPNFNGLQLLKLVELERTGTKTAFPDFYRGGIIPPADSLTAGYFFFEHAPEEILKIKYPGLFKKGNYGYQDLKKEFPKGDFSPIEELFYDVHLKNLKNQMPDHFFPRDDILHRLDPELGGLHVAKSAGIILPQTKFPDGSPNGSIESYVVRQANPSPFSIAAEIPVMPYYETRNYMHVLGVCMGEFLCRLNAMRVDKN